MLFDDPTLLARLQFGMTAMYHFLFVPLTLGLSIILGIMETIYVMTGRQIWKDMTRFWGVLFGINFAMGVATGITMEFQFGTNWSYYSHYVGDIFGVPLAIEGLMAFFLEATFVGIFFFGWNRMSKLKHLTVTWLLALGTNLSALWILIANGWMQNPVGAYFDFETMRMQVSNFADVFFNPVGQAKFVHTISAGYVTGAVFVLAISAFYLLKGRHLEIAKRSMTVAASFGLASALSVVVLGDESGYLANSHQPMKLAAIEGMWETQKAPAGLTVFGIPDQKKRETRHSIEIPYVLGLMAARSMDAPIPGIKQLVEETKPKIQQGILAYDALKKLQTDPKDLAAKSVLKENVSYLGYGLLLKQQVEDVTRATPQQIEEAAWSTVPEVTPLFWSFRAMVAFGFFFIALFAAAFIYSIRRKLETRWFLWTALFSLPLPWISSELGWFVAENGRQPWVIEGVLPTSLGVSSLTLGQILFSLAGFVIFYSFLAIIEMFLMVKYIKLGPTGVLNSSKSGE